MGVDFREIDSLIVKYDFNNCLISECNFSGLKLEKTDFSKCKIENCDFYTTDLSSSDFREAVLKGSIFENVNLSKADFTDAKEYRINPLNNKLKGAKFSMPEAVSFFDYLGIKVKF
jgi:uncharacterized protein YjbI with pentapeptide repeats